MPKSKQKHGGLLDSWGRRNRRLADKICGTCAKSFKPLRESSRYCSRQCAWAKNGGHNKKPVSWWMNSKGYIEGRIWLDDGTQINVKQHRFIVEGILGRPLLATEDVHHIDGNKCNNDPDNLQVINHGEHSRITNMREYKRGHYLKLTSAEREARSLRAISMGLAAMGRAAIAKAEGTD